VAFSISDLAQGKLPCFIDVERSIDTNGNARLIFATSRHGKQYDSFTYLQGIKENGFI
jgi:hypothetical protein